MYQKEKGFISQIEQTLNIRNKVSVLPVLYIQLSLLASFFINRLKKCICQIVICIAITKN